MLHGRRFCSYRHSASARLANLDVDVFQRVLVRVLGVTARMLVFALESASTDALENLRHVGCWQLLSDNHTSRISFHKTRCARCVLHFWAMAGGDGFVWNTA